MRFFEGKSTLFLVVLALIFMTFSVTAFAADKLTWQDCVSRAAKANPDIRAARESVKSSDNLAKASYSGFLPQVTASANVTRGNSYSFPQLGSVPLSVPAGDTQVSSGSLSLTQNVFSGFKDASLVEQGIANKSLSRATLDSTLVQVSYDLKTSFAGFLYAQEYSELADKIIKRRTENAELVELHFEGGIENMGSVMLSKAFVGQAKYDKVVARDSMDVSREQLARVMGIDDSKEFQVVGSIPLSEPGVEPDLKQIAVNTPLHRQSVATERVTEVGVTLSRANYFPVLDFVGTISAQGNNSFPNTSKRSAMLNLSLPIFTGGKDYFNAESSAAKYEAAAYQRMSVDQQLIPKLKQAFRTYTESVEKVKVDKAFLEAAEVRAEIARSKYNNGLLSFEDWDLIENDLISKQKAFLISERDRIIAEAAWEQAQGKGAIQ